MLRGRGVIDSVSNHCNFSAFHQLADYSLFAIWKKACCNFVYTSLSRNCAGGDFVIAGEHYCVNTHVFEFTDCLGRIFFDCICYSNDSQKFVVAGKENRSLALGSEMGDFLLKRC